VASNRNQLHLCCVVIAPCLIGTVVIRGPEQQVHKASHCGSKQQQRSNTMIILLLLVCARCYS